METTWKTTLAQLNEYLVNNPNISIGNNLICIPAEVRPEFWRLFDKVQSDFLKDYFPDFLERGYASY
jgi:hypothetical protein